MTARDKLARHLLIAATLAAAPAHAGVCDWIGVKAEIDQVIASDPQRTAEFRKQIATGKDSLDVLLSLTTEPTRKAIDDCLHLVGDYLSDKGFPMLH